MSQESIFESSFQSLHREVAKLPNDGAGKVTVVLNTRRFFLRSALRLIKSS